MPAADPILIITRQWIHRADEDLAVARRLLTPADGCPTASVCFHAQQGVEKYLKALLVWRQTDFPKTHNLAELVARLPARLHLGLTPKQQEQLTDYAVVTRYPGNYPPLTHAEAQAAVRCCRRVRQVIRRLLPPEARQ